MYLTRISSICLFLYQEINKNVHSNQQKNTNGKCPTQGQNNYSRSQQESNLSKLDAKENGKTLVTEDGVAESDH